MYFSGKFRRMLSALLPHAVLLFICYVVQALVFPYFPSLRVLPLILPSAVVGVAVFEGCSAGGLFGLAAGIACDVSYLQPLAMFTVLLTLIGLLTGMLSDTILARGFPTYLCVCAVSLIIIAVIELLPLILFTLIPVSSLLVTALEQTAFSLLFTPAVYFFSVKLGKRSSSRNLKGYT
jgi:hypothetical protein